MSLNFQIHQYINPYAGAEGTCYIESITQRFNFDKRGVVTVLLDNHRTTCDTIAYWKLDHPGEPEPEAKMHHRLDDVMYWLYALVILFACIQFILIIRYFKRLKGHFNRLQQEIQSKYAPNPENQD